MNTVAKELAGQREGGLGTGQKGDLEDKSKPGN